jgi:signal transduction histidine kinase
MSPENSNLFTGIILITLLFFIVALGLVFIVAMYNQRRKLYIEEKQSMNQKFESELLRTHIEVQEQTMQTIAADLHDNIGQLLSLTTLTLSSIEVKDQEKAKKKIANSLTLVNKSIRELRELAKLFNGEQIISAGLGNAIQQEINWVKRTGAYKIKADNQLLNSKLSLPDKDLIILRLFQEIINNIIKHAQATTININTYHTSQTLHVNVIEDGIGFDYEKIRQQKKGMGLYSINKRIEMIKGKIAISSNPNEGTSILIEIPYP